MEQLEPGDQGCSLASLARLFHLAAIRPDKSRGRDCSRVAPADKPGGRKLRRRRLIRQPGQRMPPGWSHAVLSGSRVPDNRVADLLAMIVHVRHALAAVAVLAIITLAAHVAWAASV